MRRASIVSRGAAQRGLRLLGTTLGALLFRPRDDHGGRSDGMVQRRPSESWSTSPKELFTLFKLPDGYLRGGPLLPHPRQPRLMPRVPDLLAHDVLEEHVARQRDEGQIDVAWGEQKIS